MPSFLNFEERLGLLLEELTDSHLELLLLLLLEQELFFLWSIWLLGFMDLSDLSAFSFTGTVLEPVKTEVLKI